MNYGHRLMNIRSASNRRRRIAGDASTTAGELICGDALHAISRLNNRSVALALFSPPYPDRNKMYPAPSEKEFPAWMVEVMAALRPKLTDTGSVLVVIRSHVRSGVVSDYLLRTRLAVRESGWKECGELIWYKPDAGFFGSIERLRRTWESVLWFSDSNKPYVNLTANGNYTDRIGLRATLRFRESGWPVAGQSSRLKDGQARGSDVFTALVRDNDVGVMHPCAFPVILAEKLILQFSNEGDLVADPFSGSGSTLIAAKRLGRRYWGCEIKREYAELAAARLHSSFSEHVVAIRPGHPVRLRTDFPESPKARRIYLRIQGLNESDAVIFERILTLTVLGEKKAPAVSISVNDLARATNTSRRTVIRSLHRLDAAGFIERTLDAEWFRGRCSMIGIASSLLVPLESLPSANLGRRVG